MSDLELTCSIGVPDEERTVPQRLTLCLKIFPQRGFSDLGDDIAKAVDYFILTQRVKRLAAERSRKLIETLADEVATLILGEFPVKRVAVELRKYILPDTQFVAVCLTREV